MVEIRAGTSLDAKAGRLPRGQSWRENLDEPLHEEMQMSVTDTKVTVAGASSAAADMWEQSNWFDIDAEVRRLQMRIAKAVREGRWGKAKALQRLLTRSHSGKMLAVKRVTENSGKKTPGVDGRTWLTPAARWKGALSLHHRGYRPMPLRRVYIPKSNGKGGPLGIPCMRCRAMQALWKLALEPIAETLADPNSYGFRPERSTADAIGQCFNCTGQRNSAQWLLEGDIRGCFDNFSHSWLLKHIPMDKAVLRQWLEAGYVDEGSLFETQAGTAQGGVISPVIANMALDGLENAVRASAGSDRARRLSKINVIRYADDFVVTCASKDVLESQVLPAIQRFLADRGLELSEDKTRITHITEGFDFLGQHVRKYGEKFLVKTAKTSIKSLLDKVRAIVEGNANATQAALIRQLNPVIRGWAMYHRHCAAKASFSSIDSHIWHMLFRWAMRRHTTKGARWVVRRYFRPMRRKSWVFATKHSADGTADSAEIFRAPTLAIRRHVKIPGGSTPFDPEWTAYLARRRAAKRSVKLFGATLWC